MDQSDLDLVKIFKALANRNRLEILKSVYEVGISGTCEACTPSVERCSCVGDIVERFKLAPSTISHHLKELSSAGLIEVEREGRFIRVIPGRESLQTMMDFAEALLQQGQTAKLSASRWTHLTGR